jgi:hypothetical protein
MTVKEECNNRIETVPAEEGWVPRLGSGFLRVLRQNWLFLLIIGGVLAGFLALRTAGSAVASVGEVDALLQAGQPTLVEFYSNT